MNIIHFAKTIQNIIIDSDSSGTDVQIQVMVSITEARFTLSLLSQQIECSSISDYAVKIVKANKLDDGELRLF